MDIVDISVYQEYEQICKFFASGFFVNIDFTDIESENIESRNNVDIQIQTDFNKVKAAIDV